MTSVLHLENKHDDKTSENHTRFIPMTQTKGSGHNIWGCLYPVCLIIANGTCLKSGKATLNVTWDQVLFSFLFVNNIPAGKEKRA